MEKRESSDTASRNTNWCGHYGEQHGGSCVLCYAQACPTLCDPMDCACQAPLCMEFSRQEYWRGLPFPVPGDLPDPGIEPTSLASPALTGEFFTTSTTWEALAVP